MAPRIDHDALFKLLLTTFFREFLELTPRDRTEMMNRLFHESGQLLKRQGSWAQKYIGDAVMSVPAVRAIKRGRPDARVSLLTPAKLADLPEARVFQMPALAGSWSRCLVGLEHRQREERLLQADDPGQGQQ